MEIENHLNNCVDRLKYITDEEEKRLDEYLKESNAMEKLLISFPQLYSSCWQEARKLILYKN